ncbi:hypothetical protein BC831DRAFT_450721 [Entophlyctis helioformis]|nr:hypothetical protein BC831DRAFT_450721 [Entophlyctis helioformis]
MSGGAGVQKTLEKLRKSVQDGNYYEAHQMYHSACQRLLKQKKPADAIELLHSGILNMVEHDQTGSAIDLAERLLDVLDGQQTALDDSARDHLVEIFLAFPLQSAGCDQFTRLCIRWSSKNPQFPLGDPSLHHVFGSRYFKEQQYYDAESHFVYGTIDSAKALGIMAFEWSRQDTSIDAGYFINRAVLQLLAINRIDEAKAAFTSFVASFRDANPDAVTDTIAIGSGQDFSVYSSAHMSFVELTLEAIDRNAGDVLSNMLTAFRPLLAQDPFVLQMAEVVAGNLFNVGPRRKQVNPFAEIMKGLFADPGSGAGGNNRSAIMPPDSAEMD